MEISDFTLYIAVYAMILAAVNVFNSHVNTPYILNPIVDRVQFYRKCLNVAKENLRFKFSKEEIDNKINWLEWFLRIQKLLTFLYNISVLTIWVNGTFHLIKKDFKLDDILNPLFFIIIASIILMALGVIFRGLIWIFSDSKNIKTKENQALEEINSTLSKNTTIEINLKD